MRKRRKSTIDRPARARQQSPATAATKADQSLPKSAENENEPTGRLQIHAYTGSEALPVGGVVVTISSCDKDGDGKRDVIAHLITDQNGNTPVIEVPVAKPTDSPYPYADCSNYVIKLYPNGYYPVQVANIHVYENVTSRLPVPLVPIMEHEMEDGTVTWRSPNKIYHSDQEEGDDCDA